MWPKCVKIVGKVGVKVGGKVGVNKSKKVAKINIWQITPKAHKKTKNHIAEQWRPPQIIIDEKFACPDHNMEKLQSMTITNGHVPRAGLVPETHTRTHTHIHFFPRSIHELCIKTYVAR